MSAAAAAPGATLSQGQGAALLAARLLLAPLFVYSGTGKVMAFAATAARLPGGDGPLGQALTVAAICAELGGAALLVLGWRVRLAALGLILFTAVATLMFHQFWASPPAAVVPQAINFLKNLGLVGCLGLVAAFGAGPFSVDGRQRTSA